MLKKKENKIFLYGSFSGKNFDSRSICLSFSRLSLAIKTEIKYAKNCLEDLEERIEKKL
jgi:hypothetical protein